MDIRKAKVTDVAAIQALVRPFAEERRMLALSIGDITERLRDFLLLEDGGAPIGCVAVHVVWDRLVEIRSLAVLKARQGEGLGRKLVDAAKREARDLGATQVFTLSFVPDFFRKQGFSTVDRRVLPHKVWQDCTHCPLFPDCGETALMLELGAGMA